MPIHLDRVAAALSAYPWTPGAYTAGAPGAAHYCAIGALLRYAGVAQDHIACLGWTGEGFWRLYGKLLNDEYGIADQTTAEAVIYANDSAPSQAEAIERVLGVLWRSLDLDDGAAPAPETEERPRASTAGPPHVAAGAAEWGPEPDDGAGSLALLA